MSGPAPEAVSAPEAGPAAVAGVAREDGVDVIVVAAGASRRMGGPDKLLWQVAGQPLLAHTLTALAAAPEVDTIIVVTTPERGAAISDAVSRTRRGIRTAVVPGGARRQASVALGFAALEELVPDPQGGRPVLVHDGARPLVSPALVASVAAAVRRHGAAIPVVPIAETVKRVVDGRITDTVDRSELGTAQTPQGARRGLLREAFARYPLDAPDEFTDEAALLEACRIPVHVVPGDPSNLKVTVPADLDRVAGTLAPGASGGTPASSTERAPRVGIGRDLHPFGPGEPLLLGGVEIAGAPRLYGHSDGDVVLHAIADALLGAAGSGDLGRLFPAGPSTPEGIASSTLLRDVVARLAGDGWRPVALDLTIVGARPRLGAHLEPMRAAISALLGVDAAAVNVKASTGNLAGSEGAGRSISALALVTIGSDGSIA